MKPTRYPLETGKIAPRIVAWLVEGRSHDDIAGELTTRRKRVTRQAVTAFAKRHAAEIEQLRAKAAAVVEELTIANQAERLRRLGKLYDIAETELLDAGLWREEPKWIGGEHGYEVALRRFDAPALMAVRALSHEMAEQLGEIPKAGIQINTGDTLNVNLVNIEGYTPEQQAAILRLALRAAERGA